MKYRIITKVKPTYSFGHVYFYLQRKGFLGIWNDVFVAFSKEQAEDYLEALIKHHNKVIKEVIV